MAAALTIPEFLARSRALEARLRAVLPEYTLLYEQYENVRNEALPENNPVPGGAGEVNMVDADNLRAEVDTAFANVMNAIEQICLVNQAGGQRRRKRRSRKSRRNK